MFKKSLSCILITFIIIFSLHYSFAADMNTAINNVRNMVGNAENTVENAAQNMSNTSKNVTNDIQETANNVSDDTKNNINDMKNNVENTPDNSNDKQNNNMIGTTIDSGNNSYQATRTSTNNNFLGFSNNSWFWIIVTLSVVAIIALIYFYSITMTNKHQYDDK